MRIKNTTETYGLLTKIFHWLMAVLIIGMLVVGFIMEDIEPLTTRFQVYGLHKSTGILILMLVALRFSWHRVSKKPALLPTLKWWEAKLAHLIHGALYLGMVGMPLSGWLLSSAAGRPVSVYGLLTLPDLVAPNEKLRDIFGEIHEITAFALIGAVALHAAAAFKHHVIDKDGTLRRMLPVVMFAVAALSSGTAIAAKNWTLLPAESVLTFKGSQMGKSFEGRFDTFTTTIAFSADDLAGSSVTAEIDTGSATSNDKDVAGAVTSAEWLNAAAFPKAVFQSTGFTADGKGGFVAAGNLTIKGVTLPVTLPFTLKTTTGADGTEIAEMTGETHIKRLPFKLGEGSWADTSAVADDVAISVKIKAQATP